MAEKQKKSLNIHGLVPEEERLEGGVLAAADGAFRVRAGGEVPANLDRDFKT